MLERSDALLFSIEDIMVYTWACESTVVCRFDCPNSTESNYGNCSAEAGRFSLIDRNPQNKTLDIHRLVQAVVRDGMEKAEQRRWAEHGVRAVNRAFPAV